MKKGNKFTKALLTLAAVASVSVVSLSVANVLDGGSVVAQAAQTAEVSTIQEFEAALMNGNVDVINVNKSINFRKNITNVPNRDFTINGNRDNGVVITSGHFTIYGKQNTAGMKDTSKNNTVSFVNVNAVGAEGDGRLFTGGAGNGPGSYGWNVRAENIKYEGSRMFHLSEGKLTIAGTNNEVTTNAENAWVRHLEFEPGTVYNGIAANKDHWQYSCFYYNGALVDAKAVGTVKIGDNANINIKIGPKNNINYYYPAFYDKVQRVDVGKSATLDIDAAGVGFQFIPRADYVDDVPTLNLDQGSKMYVNGRGGGNYATMKLQYYGNQINMATSSELVVTGNSKKGVVESEYRGADINLYQPRNFEVKNKMAGQKLFYATGTSIHGANVSRVLTWNQVGGEYLDPAHQTIAVNPRYFTTNFGKLCNSQSMLHVGGLGEEFQMQNYGKVSFQGGGF